MNYENHGDALDELAEAYRLALVTYNICKETGQTERADMFHSSMVSSLSAMSYHAEQIAKKLVKREPVIV